MDLALVKVSNHKEDPVSYILFVDVMGEGLNDHDDIEDINRDQAVSQAAQQHGSADSGLFSHAMDFVNGNSVRPNRSLVECCLPRNLFRTSTPSQSMKSTSLDLTRQLMEITLTRLV